MTLIAKWGTDMAFCRWSSMDHMCDLYVYEDGSGQIYVGVASNRKQPVEPLPDQIEYQDNPEAYVNRIFAVNDILKRSDSYPIGLSRDGESFWCDTYQEAADLVQSLKDEGYNVPDGVVDALRMEESDG